MLRMENNGKKTIFIFGASGHAKVVIDIMERQGVYSIACLVDDNPLLTGREFFGYRVIGGKDELLVSRIGSECRHGIVAIGSNPIRGKISAWLTEHGFQLASAIHPSAVLSRGAVIGLGTVIMAGAAVNADAIIGDNVIINTGATVDHDCFIGNRAHIAPGSTLCGNVRVGEGTFIGAGATVIPNITIGSNAVVGAGATVVRDVPDGVQVIGTPARVVCKY